MPFGQLLIPPTQATTSSLVVDSLEAAAETEEIPGIRCPSTCY